MNKLEVTDLASIAQLFFGIPYTWGGNNPTTGFDCSGFICEVMRSGGLLDKRDLTAQGIYNYLLKINEIFFDVEAISSYERNGFAFYGKNTAEITHVALLISSTMCIEAAGEGRVETDKGYVRVRSIANRTDLLDVIFLKI